VVHSGTTVTAYKNSSFLTNAVVGLTTNTPAIWLGRHPSNAYPLVGGIDDVRFYNRALSDSEAQQLYAFESGPRVDLIKIVQPSLSNLTLGTNYQLQVSTDLNSWTNQGAAFTATNGSMVYPQYFDVPNWNQRFFRVQVAP